VRIDPSHIVFTHHARKRMERRKIIPAVVVQTLADPSIVLPRFEDGTQEFRRAVGDRTHFVVVSYAKEGIVKVITTGWSREA
jgi:hypothetical protein